MGLRKQLDAVMVSQRSTTQPGNFDWGKRIVISGALVVDTAGHQMENSLEQKVEVTLMRASLMDQLLRQVISHAFVMTLHGLCQYVATAVRVSCCSARLLRSLGCCRVSRQHPRLYGSRLGAGATPSGDR